MFIHLFPIHIYIVFISHSFIRRFNSIRWSNSIRRVRRALREGAGSCVARSACEEVKELNRRIELNRHIKLNRLYELSRRIKLNTKYTKYTKNTKSTKYSRYVYIYIYTYHI